MPTLGIPIAIPVAVRTGGDYGLRFTVQDITQLTPLAEAKLTLWGFPAESEPQRRTLRKGPAGRTLWLCRPRRYRLHQRTDAGQ